MKVNSSVKLNMPAIRRLTEAATTALEMTAEHLHTEIVQAQVVPRDTGNLQGESFFVDDSKSKNGKVSLVHSTPYARRLYFHPEYKFSKIENPHAKGKWFEDWTEGGKREKDAIKAYAEFYRRLTGV
ncbi:MAG: hypothetical protein J6B94_08615 [Lachnospiraceae bacterium]|nr:hypothetical protein [Lachnospiraceae bacterium]